MYEIMSLENDNRNIAVKIIEENWGSSVVVTRGKVHSPENLPGFVAFANNKVQGLITYNMADGECEIVSLNSYLENQGLGSALIRKVIEAAKSQKCSRVWLITTNDNTKAIRFYQKRGFSLAGIHLNAIKESRKIKPQIPLYGFDDIPILHEIEFEIVL